MNDFLLASTLLATGLMLPTAAAAPPDQPIAHEAAREIFDAAQATCEADGGALWGAALCGPIMLVDPSSRAIVANQPDAQDRLQATAAADLHVGRLPDDQNMANTAVDWAGVRWTQVLWPLPADAAARRALLMHEMFHRIQHSLDLPDSTGAENTHLDTARGRTLLQLEWRALAAALGAKDRPAHSRAVEDALLFASERHQAFTEAAASERALMLHEGLAEYTGVRLAQDSAQARTAMALGNLEAQARVPSFVRSFAAGSGPAYGLLLDRADPNWRTRLADGISLQEMLAQALGIRLPVDGVAEAQARAARYDGEALAHAEAKRQSRREGELKEYRARFVESPVLRIGLRKMNIQFDPRNLVPLGAEGTVYPTLRISDEWGVLEVTDGALLAQEWDAVAVSAPVAGEGHTLSGRGWTLKLAEGWTLGPGDRTGDLQLVHNPR